MTPPALRLYNTATNRVEPVRVADPASVTFYTCGPTVYDYAHIGNFRSFLAADLLRRYLESPFCNEGRGYDVAHIVNMTDVGHMTDDEVADGSGEDKMEVARKRLLEDKKSGKLPAGVDIDPSDPMAVAEFYIHAFLKDSRALGFKVAFDQQEHAEVMPRPTQYIQPMIDLVQTLIDSGHAYVAVDGVVYFDTQSFPKYGQLSGNTLDRLRSGAGGRVTEDTQAVKKHPADFMLWKPDKTHLMRWDSPWGEGYPGWHLECSVMAQHLLGADTNGVIDLHSGGEDNLFPHHECEVAQSCGATGEEHFARYWFHPRHLFVEGGKMSKSKGTFYTLQQLCDEGYAPAAIRLELIRTHYRSNANFTFQGLKDSAKMLARWKEARIQIARQSLAWNQHTVAAARKRLHAAFKAAMDDDLNIAGAMGEINKFLNEAQGYPVDDTKTVLEERDSRRILEEYPEQVDELGLLDVFADIGPVLGVFELEDAAEPTAAADVDAALVESKIAERAQARKAKDWGRADAIREELDALGVELIDSAKGTTWKVKTG
ncbi:MAG: cysteine--tRNA ligase [Phycisphaerales bacterium JB040]